MKRKNKSRQSIGYQQLENRWLLAALANGQEVTTSFAAGQQETFELQVTNGGPVRFLLSQSDGSNAQPVISVADPSGQTVATDTYLFFDASNNIANAPSVRFDASAPGTYTISVSDEGNNDAMTFTARAIAVLDPFVPIEGRDESLVNGREIDLDVPTGRLNIYTFDVDAGASVSIAGGFVGDELVLGGLSHVEVFDSEGNLVSAPSIFPFDFGLPSDLFVESSTSTRYTIVAENAKSPFSEADVDWVFRAISQPGTPELIPARDVPAQFGSEIMVSSTAGTTVHTFSVDSPGPIRISARSNDFVNLRLFDPDGDFIAAAVEADSSSSLTFNAVASGQYTALVTSRSSERFVDLISLSQPANGISLANGEEQIVSLDLGETSVFTLPVTNPGLVLFSAGGVGDDQDSSVSVFAPDGTMLVASESERTNRVDFQADFPGEYTIILENTFGLISLDYRVRAFAVQDNIALVSGLDGLLDNGTKTSVAISNGSFGIFPIEVTTSGRTFLSTSGPRASETSIRLFDGSGNEIDNSDFESASQLSSFVASTGQPETYTAVVVPGPSTFEDPDITIDIRRVSLNEEISPNAENVTVIQNGETISGEFDSGEFAVVSLEAQTSGAVYFAVNQAGRSVDLAVASGDGETILGTNTTNNAGVTTVQAEGNEAGTHYAIVTGNGTREFTIRGISTPGDPLLATGKDAILQSGQPATSNLVLGETGIFLLDVEADDVGPVFLNLKNADDGSVFSPPLSVFGPNGNPVELSSMLGGESTPRVFQAEQPGRYYIIVAETNNAFTIQANVLASDLTLANGEEAVQSASDGRTNVFAFEVDAPGTVYASLSAVNSGFLPASVTLLDASGTLVSFENILTFSGDNQNPRLIQLDAITAGEYFVVVDPSGGFDDDIRFRSINLNSDYEAIAGRDQILGNGVRVEQSNALPGALSFYQIDVTTPGTVFVSQYGSGNPNLGSLFLTGVFNSSGELVRDFTTISGMFTAHSAGTYLVFGLTFPSVEDVSIRLIEPNSNTALLPDQEAALTIGTELTSRLSERQISIFPLEVVQSGPLTVFAHTGGSSELLLVGPNGVIDQDYERGAGFRSITVQDTAPGSYYVVLNSFSFSSESQDVRIRTFATAEENEFIAGRDALIGGDVVTGTIPAGSVGKLVVPVTSTGTIRLLFESNEGSGFVEDEKRQVITPDGRLLPTRLDEFWEFDADMTGDYTLIYKNDMTEPLTFSAGRLPQSGDSPVTTDLDHILQNGQELVATLPENGVAIVPLDIDFSEPGIGRLHATGVFDGVSIVPLVQIYDSEGTLISDNRDFNFGDTDFGTIAFLPQNDVGPLFAVITSPNTPGPIDYRLRALRDGPSILIPGRDAILEDGIPFTSTIPVRQVAQFPVELSSPGSVSVDIGITQSDSAIQNGATVGFIARVQPSDLTTSFVFVVEFSDANFDFEVTEAGTYTILIEQLAFNSSFVFDPLPAFDDQQIEITVSGISQVPVLVTSFERDGRISSREEVLAQPDAVDQLTLRFNQDVAIERDDLVLRNESTGGNLVNLSGVGFTYDPDTLSATWDLTTLGTPLPAGFYSATLAAGSIASVASGDGMAEAFSRRFHVALPGDVNLDGVVDVLNDAFALVANLGTENGALWSDGDFNGDGAVDVLGDAFGLVSSLGRSIVPPEVISFQRDDTPTEDQVLLSRPDLAEKLTVDFSVDVNIDSNDLILRNESEDSLVDLSGATFTYDATTLQAQWDLTTLTTPLPAGYYSVQILADSVTEKEDDQVLLTGYSDEFYVALAGDTNLDGTVDVLTDAFQLVGNLGRDESASWSLGDFNNDGGVDVLSDAFVLIGNLGRTVVPPALAASTSFPVAATTSAAADPDVALSRDIAFTPDEFWFEDEDENAPLSSSISGSPVNQPDSDPSTLKLS